MTQRSACATIWIHSDLLRAGRSRHHVPVGARFSPPVQTGPGAHPASSTLYRVSSPVEGVVKRSGCGVNHPPPPQSSAEVKERVELCLYSLSGPSWPVLGRTSLFYLNKFTRLFCLGKKRVGQLVTSYRSNETFLNVCPTLLFGAVDAEDSIWQVAYMRTTRKERHRDEVNSNGRHIKASQEFLVANFFLSTEAQLVH